MKFCILAAGVGLRNNSVTGLHKGLLPIENIPMISHVIRTVNPEHEIIIAVGHLSEQIISYIKFVHPEKKVKFVRIDHYAGEGSGPGYSLLQCKDELQCPFVFGTIDTFFDESTTFDVKNNWIGVSKIKHKLSKKYCLVKGVKKLESLYYGEGTLAYNGFAGIYDFEKFWKELETPTLINNEHQVTTALDKLENVELKYFDNFYDTGTEEGYISIRKKIGNEIVFAKNDEVIFLDNKKVVKYFTDENKCQNRIKRVNHLGELIPETIQLNSNMFGYIFVEGKLLSEIIDKSVFLELLEKFYSFATKVNNINMEEFHSDCTKMYKTKTMERIKYFQDTTIDRINFINGKQVELISEIVKKIDWDEITTTAFPTKFHGDFQPENIIIGKENEVRLIDWRESFGKNIEIGDFYYDLAKLYHGLIINGNIAKEKKYSVNLENNNAVISYSTKDNLIGFKSVLEDFCIKHNLDYKKVQLLGVLQYLNIAEVYTDTEPEYSKFIFLLGKLLMTEIMGEKK